jgi:hypothetical protein
VGDSIEEIRDRIERLKMEAESLIAKGEAKSQDEADQASDLATTLGELESRCTDLHKAEKAPHLAAGRAVDGAWFPLRDIASTIKKRLKAAVVSPFLAKAEKSSQEAAAKAIAQGASASEAAPPVVRAGSMKRATGLKWQTTANVTDWLALLTALQEHPDLRHEAQRIANASAKAGMALPGTEIKKERVAA